MKKIVKSILSIFCRKKRILKLISENEKIIIEPLDGGVTITQAWEIFRSFIDPDFQNWNLDNPGPATAETCLDVYEMAEDATFKQMFTSLNSGLDKLVLTQNQIICFCKKHPAWLCQEGYGTFFLIKKNNEYFVVRVLVYSGGLHVRVYQLEDGHVWRAGALHRLVAPQLIPLDS